MQNVKQKLAWLWQNAERILIVVFFLSFSFNVRKVFLTPFSFLHGGFNEYTTIAIGWADLLMLATIAIYTTKSILRQVINPYYASPDHEKIFEKPFKNVSRETLYLLIFLGWVGLSIFWSQYRPVAVYRFLTLAEIVLFAFIAIKSLRNSKWLDIAFFALVLSGLFQSLLGVAQFIHNGSLGLHFLGESIIGPNIDGVAKIIISSEKHVRAYGTFPHPNILAGFLLIPLFIIIAELVQRRFILTSSQYFPYQREGGDNSPILYKEGAGVRCDNVPHETFLSNMPHWFLWLAFTITSFGFLLTFSRSAFFGFFVGLSVFLIWLVKNYYPEFFPFSKGGLRRILGIQSSKNPSPALPLQKGERRNYRMFLCSLFVLLIFLFLIFKYTSFFSNQSLEERQFYQDVSYETISSNPLQGIGAGQFVLNENKLHPYLESWQYQPVHNTYLLIFSELGIVGFIFLILFFISFFFECLGDRANKKNCILTNRLFYCIVFSFLVIWFFDHYFWDIKLGMLIFALPLIIYYVTIRQKRKLDKEL